MSQPGPGGPPGAPRPAAPQPGWGWERAPQRPSVGPQGVAPPSGMRGGPPGRGRVPVWVVVLLLVVAVAVVVLALVLLLRDGGDEPAPAPGPTTSSQQASPTPSSGGSATADTRAIVEGSLPEQVEAWTHVQMGGHRYVHTSEPGMVLVRPYGDAARLEALTRRLREAEPVGDGACGVLGEDRPVCFVRPARATDRVYGLEGQSSATLEDVRRIAEDVVAAR